MSSSVSIIPQPGYISTGAGAFTLNEHTRIAAPAAAAQVAEQFAAWLRVPTGLPLPVETASGGSAAEPNTITLAFTHGGEFGREGYGLQAAPESVTIRAADVPGLFYGTQTLRQLLPVEAETRGVVSGVEWAIPEVTIEDEPRYGWRGMHLDVGRHFFPVDKIRKFLDTMALHKFNVFHWHLTEDQGWRIEIQRYSELIEVGAWRDASPYPADRYTLDGKPHGGFYTQQEVKDIVAYAQALNITIVPEIEMPGHAVAALASYPELGCVGEGYKVRQFWGIAEDVFCAGSPEVYTFLENVLDEVLALFPGEYIHIGGDECPKVRWKECPRCQALIQREGLADEHELQSYFIRHFERYLNERGRRLIGWDEILEGGLAPNATVMSWRGSKGGIEAASQGHDVVMTPNTHCYFDYYQSEDRSTEPPTIGGFIPLEKVYTFDPTEGIPADKTSHVLGGQGNIWTEYMPTWDIVEYMAFPRAAAMAEALWSDPAGRDYEDFIRRLRPFLQRLDILGVQYRSPFA
jgi:hexosaminidase